MKILKNIFTALRGGVSEVGESIVNSQSIRILEQKMREAENALDKGENALTSVMADHEASEREVKAIETKLEEYGLMIQHCLEKDALDLAREVAEKIAELEPELQSRKVQSEKLMRAETVLKSQRKKSSTIINEMKRQISIVKAQENMNNSLKIATEAVGTEHPEFGQLSSLIDRIQMKQQHESDQIIAAEQLKEEDAGLDLDEKLTAAGVMQSQKSSVDDILNRYKKHG